MRGDVPSSAAQDDEIVNETLNQRPAARWARWTPNGTVFLASACMMMVELIAGRIISRHVGQSLYTWTSVIGVVLAGISIGNYVGGWVADRFDAGRALAVLFLLSAASCLTVPVVNHLAGQWSWLIERSWPLRILLHVLLTFIFPSAMLGTISPVVAKTALACGARTGRTIGDVYAWGAAGSIAGTFLAGFFLIAVMGSSAMVGAVAAILAAMGLLYSGRFRTSSLDPVALKS